jgi:serine/threonine-protein kinase
MQETCSVTASSGTLRRCSLVALLAFVLSFLLCSAPRAALANDLVDAQALFDEARRLMASGAYAEACPKLAESQRLDPGIGTLFNLADCYEHMGRLASAWAMYLDVAAAARAARQAAREEVARDRASALEPRLCHLTIALAAGAASVSPLVSRDDTMVRREQWGLPVPVDPGLHTVRAAAEGRKPWSTKLEISGEGRSFAVDVPELDAEPSSVVPADGSRAATAPPTEPGARRALRWGLLGLSGGSVAVGAILAVKSVSDRTSANAFCTGNLCKEPGFDERTTAVREGNLASVAFSVGAAAALACGFVWLTAPRGETPPQPARLRPGLNVSSRAATLSFEASW